MQKNPFCIIPFNSRPHAEVDSCLLFLLLRPDLFQLTTSRRGRLTALVASLVGVNFQLTTSRRGRLADRFGDVYGDIFQLTTSRRGRLGIQNVWKHAYFFQLTTSRRGRLSLILQITKSGSFNSRPHAEVDWFCFSVVSGIILSTHDLTQRSTDMGAGMESTDAFNSRPHAEVDKLVKHIGG